MKLLVNVITGFTLIFTLAGCGNKDVGGETTSPSDSEIEDAKTLPKSLDLNTIDFTGKELVSLKSLQHKLFRHGPEANVPPKDEFETTPAYEERIKGFKPYTSIFGDIPYENYYFSYKPERFSYKLEFDADKQELALKLNTSIFFMREEVEKNREDTTAKNKFGEEIDIIHRDLTKYEVIHQSYDFLDTFPKSLPMTPEQARVMKNTLEPIVIFTLHPPWMQALSYEEEIRRDNPVSGTTTTHLLQGEIAQIWLIDKTTRKVIQKWVNSIPKPELSDIEKALL